MKPVFWLRLLGVVAGWCFSTIVNGQGIVRGKITDQNGESVIGATVVLKTDKSYGTTADFDGNYSIKINNVEPQVLLITFISFKTVELTVNPRGGEVIIKNITLYPAAQDVKQVDIVAKAVRSRDYFMEKIKSNSATTIDYISSESIRKTGDANVSSAVARVTGVSSNGGFITVRGVGDRYIKTAINGMRIPTLDPFTNNIKLDIFPSAVMDNLVITKTQTAELPGDWSGAYLSIETKDFPEQLTVNTETTFGYNTNATFKDVVSSSRSNTDWLGFDNNLRNHDHSKFQTYNASPSMYQEMEALGLGSYYASLGITGDNWKEGAAYSDTYFKLGLVQLGLLAPALFNDPVAVAQAKMQYINGSYKDNAYMKINADVPATGKSFPSNWNITSRKAPLNFSQSLSIGNQTNVFGLPFGFIGAFRYGTSQTYDPHATATRPRYDGSVSSQLEQQSSVETNGWSALLSGSLKFNPNNSISLLFMPNQTGVNRVRKAYDKGDKTITVTNNQFYEQRRQMIYQLKAEDYFPLLKIKSEVMASYTRGHSTAPDFKNLQYWKNPDTTYQIGGSIGDGIHRYYRYLTDNVFDSKWMLDIPITKSSDKVRKLKTGVAYQRNDRKSKQYDYAVYLSPNAGVLTNEDIDAYLNPGQFGFNTYTDVNGNTIHQINAWYVDLSSPADQTFGYSNLYGAYLNIDYALTNRLRFTGGLRYEYATIYTDVILFDSLGLKKNDPRRKYSESYPVANPGSLTSSDILPSAGIIFKLIEREKMPVNIRLNYAQSLARPSIRELSDIAGYDYELRAPVFGNSDLKPVSIHNYDFRAETLTPDNFSASVSLFYKNFRNHIELINNGGYTWQNVDKSWVAGLELEGRKNIIKNIELGTNITLVKSETNYVRSRFNLVNGIKEYVPVDTLSRAMYGQAPYIINAIVSYKNDSIGFVATLSFNVQGPRLVIASDNPSIPDVYEMPRNLFDIKLSQRLSKHFMVSFLVRDVLNTAVRRAYKYPEGYNKYNYDKYKYGTTYNVSFGYRL
jgi:TonB-dependent receptor